MISSSTLSETMAPHAPTSNGGFPHSEPRSPISDVEPSSPETPGRRTRPNPQLSRWSMARAVRSGRKLSRSVRLPGHESYQSDSPSPVSVDDRARGGGELLIQSPRSDVEDVADVAVATKSIYMVSDGTGWTAEHSVTAALGQFEHPLVDRGCSVSTHLFSGVDDMDRLIEIIAQASKEEALLVYTLADPSFAASAKQACEIWGVVSLDILGPITEAIASHLGVSPSGLPRWAPQRKRQLGEEYFKRIEAVEFTIKQDDGALPENLHKADLILTGVSRTGKTPLSIYLSQKGYKVANVPIVMNVDLPDSLFEEDEEKVFALTINPVVLHTIRRARAKSLSFSDEMRCMYSDMDHVRRELDYATKIFQRNPNWPVIEVTGRAIEETAAIILRLYHDRKNKCLMPRISRRY